MISDLSSLIKQRLVKSILFLKTVKVFMELGTFSLKFFESTDLLLNHLRQALRVA